MTEPNAQPQISPDGQWKWDGTQWVPNTTYPTQPGYGTPPAHGTAPAYGTAYPPAAYATAPPPSQTHGKAIASLVLSLVGLCGVGSLIAVILGHQSRGQAKREGRPPSGMALAGVIIGYVGLVATVAVFVLFAVGTWVEGAFEDTTTCVSQYADSC